MTEKDLKAVTNKVLLPIYAKTTYYIKGRDLIRVRDAAGLSQQELAAQLDTFGWSQRNISDIESSTLGHQIGTDVISLLESAGINTKIQEPHI